MKDFHISDILTVTTGRLVSSRHMEGCYDLLNFLTQDSGLFTHQLPRAMEECTPWLRTQFPQLMEDSPEIVALIEEMSAAIASTPQTSEAIAPVVAAWVERVRLHFGLPEMIPVYEMPAGLHVEIDPGEELEAMVGADRVLAVRLEDTEA